MFLGAHTFSVDAVHRQLLGWWREREAIYEDRTITSSPLLPNSYMMNGIEDNSQVRNSSTQTGKPCRLNVCLPSNSPAKPNPQLEPPFSTSTYTHTVYTNREWPCLKPYLPVQYHNICAWGSPGMVEDPPPQQRPYTTTFTSIYSSTLHWKYGPVL